MTKKKYQSPQIEIIAINSESQIMAGSNNIEYGGSADNDWEQEEGGSSGSGTINIWAE